ncbi:hypothetical protein L227DRAFT_608537 [Lentinus tigrinus ALCF2SS1-6]|uniref:Uncharacterized protein n=1 Tax=Lentinus tigrinus ALCF2SS1-6 TaxID=1328759 RepID=A0A5C2SJ89_9APHY|nr:hypothetical protein L227DRAFT_608537 [Lentinus tigrinus ALCF2SS1-6]
MNLVEKTGKAKKVIHSLLGSKYVELKTYALGLHAGGHLVLWDLKLIIEIPPVYLIPSVILKHSNVTIGPDKISMSMTQFFAGGLVHWVACGALLTCRYNYTVTGSRSQLSMHNIMVTASHIIAPDTLQEKMYHWSFTAVVQVALAKGIKLQVFLALMKIEELDDVKKWLCDNASSQS